MEFDGRRWVEILLFFYGTGASGKSTFLNIISKAAGDYAQRAALDLLLAKKGDSHPTELADLFRARFVVSSELEDGRRFTEALIKQITGGDRIRARRMREDLWEFEPTHTVIVAANHKPEVRGTDEGIWRRIKIVPWEVRIPKGERDPNLPKKLEAELEGILAWAVQGAVEWYENGLDEPEEVRSQTHEYQGEMDVLANFIFERCVEAPGVSVISSELFRAWEMWCSDNNENPGHQTRFSTRLKERGYKKDRLKSGPNKGQVLWYDIAIRSDGGGGGPKPPVNPSPSADSSLDPSPAESGVGKPKTQRAQKTSEGLDPKISMNAHDTLANGVLTGKTLHYPSLPPNPSLITNEDELHKRLKNFGGSR